jgi:hypothetical protein
MITFQNRPTLTLDAAQFLVAKAIEHAESLGLKISACVLDHSGHLKSFASMDDAPLVSLEASIKKAKTAVGFGIPTGESWYEFMKDDPKMLIGAQHLPDFILLGGASPIHAEGKLIGALGVSGGHYSQDEKCVANALKALESAK